MKRITVILTALLLSLSALANSLSPKGEVGGGSISFVTPSIVRVQWSIGDRLEGNNTGVCVYTKQNVKVKTKETKDEIIYRSSDITVVYSKNDGSISFRDNNSKEILKQLSRSAEPVYQENIVYDEKSAHTEETANGKVTVRDIIRRDTIGRSTRYIASFSSPNEKALYGLGCQMEDYMNLKGKTVYLTQHNLKIHVPMLVSTNGYGLLFDAGCAMKYSPTPTLPAFVDGQNAEGEHCNGYTMQLEAAKELDYYFIYGSKDSPLKGDLEGAVAGYRYLTGKVSMMPRYVFGYTQSKERYCSSDELISVLKEYRRRHVPIDMIVQDWNYWPQGWGYMKMDPKFYPDPKALADSIHALNAKLMVSIWPNPQWCPEAEDFKARGMMLPNDVYNVFDPETRKHYWKYANDEFFSKGFDAWWCDSSEPLDGDWNKPPTNSPEGEKYGWDSHEYRWQLNKDILSASLGAERSSLYSLYHSMGIYENQRATISSPRGFCPPITGETKGVKRPLSREGARVVNLTRSSYAGQQRYGTIVWNGDTHASWQSFRDQIPASLNYMATGNPYWTVDVGSFFTRDDGRRWFYKGEFPEGVNSDAYKEYYVRMFQWATFLPMLRSHGSDTPREIWRFETSPNPSQGGGHGQYYDAILKMINLRYQHIPYIYSMAAMQSGLISSPRGSREGASMARPLAFDYPEDENVLDMKDEYMFGDYLVCPVTHPLSETTTRKVYLPKGSTWINYWTGEAYNGGQWMEYNLLNTQNNLTKTPNGNPPYGGGAGGEAGVGGLPLFVRGGSVIPTTEVAEYAAAQVGKPITINVYGGKDASFTLYEDEGDNYNYEKGEFTEIPMVWKDAKKTLTIGTRKGSFKGMQDTRTFIIKTPSVTKSITYNGKNISIKL